MISYFKPKPYVKCFPILFKRFLVENNDYWAKNSSIGWGMDRPI